MMLSFTSCICSPLRGTKDVEASPNLPERLLDAALLPSCLPSLCPTPAPLPLWISSLEAVTSGEEVQAAPY